MATLSASDIYFMYTGTATGVANASLALGGTMNTSTITDALANNVYDDVSGDESATGTIEYRCIAIKDSHATADMLNAKVWTTGYVRAGTSFDVISFAIEQTVGTGSLMNVIANAYTAPSQPFTVKVGGTVAWTAEGAPSSTLTYGTVAAGGGWMGLWLRRSVPLTAAAFSNRSVTIQVQCESTGSPLYSITKTYVVNMQGDAISVVDT
jgi:hypothetical protein